MVSFGRGYGAGRWVVMGFALGAGGCALVAGVTDLAPYPDGGQGAPDGGRSDATRIDGAVRDARPEATRFDGARDARGEADAAVTCGTTCCVLYVSPQGSDANDGCSETRPMRTIKSAVGDVATAGVAGQEIHICAGTYVETDLALTAPITLRGAYDCTSWKRSGGYGFPVFDRLNETVVQQASAGSNTATLTIGPPASGNADSGTAGFTVDGLTVEGAMSAMTASEAILVQIGMAPVLSNNVITGGAASEQPRALSIVQATPEVTMNSIGFVPGGTGSSIGVSVTMSALPSAPAVGPHVHGNTITGGSTTATPMSIDGSVGVLLAGFLTMTAAHGAAFEGNTVSGGTGMGSGPSANSAIGMIIAGGASVDLIGNTVSGGTAGTASPGNYATVAVIAEQAGALTFSGNRIYGGESTSGNAGTAAISDALPSGPQVLVDNFIHGGINTSGMSAASSPSVGLECSKCDGARIEDNTFFAGSPAMGGNVAALDLSDTGTGIVVRGNIFAGPDDYVTPVTDFAIDLDACTELALLENNLFINQATGILAASTCDGVVAVYAHDVSTLQTTDLPGVASNNVQIASICSTADISAGFCISLPGYYCPSHVTCLAGLIAGWDVASYGTGALFGATAWSLQAGDPCRVTQQGALLSGADAGPVTTDAFGALRGLHPSLGAAQFNGSCH